MNPKISVIIPVYNSQKYLKKAIDSIVNQTIGVQYLEIIIVDDGSTDNSLMIIEKYKEQFPDNFIIKKIKNSGSSIARNTGIDVSKGEYISFIDSDDYIDNEMYEKMINVAQRDNSDMVVCGAKVLNEEGKILKYWKSGDVLFGGQNIKERKESLINILPAPWNKLYKRELFFKHNIRFPKGIRHQDLATIPRLLLHCNKISKIDKYFYNYIIHNGSITRTYDRKILDIIEVLSIVNNYYKIKKCYNYFIEELEFLNIEHLLFRATSRAINIKNTKLRKEVCNELLVFLNSQFPKWYNNKYIENVGFIKKSYLKMVQLGLYNLATSILAIIK